MYFTFKYNKRISHLYFFYFRFNLKFNYGCWENYALWFLEIACI